MVRTVEDFITSKGEQVVSDAARVPVTTVRVWKTRRKLPRSRWLELSQAFPELDLETLRQMHGEAPARAA